MRTVSLLFKTLSDPTRLRILLMLRVRPMYVCEIREVLQLAISTVSKHLSILRNAGFIVDYKEGRWIYYRRNDDPNARHINSLLALVDSWLDQERQAKADSQKAAQVDRYKICNLIAALKGKSSI